MKSKRAEKRVNQQRRIARRENSAVVDRVIAAADAFRRGKSVLIRQERASILATAVETLSPPHFLAFKRAQRELHLVLTHARAKTLRIQLYTPSVVALAVEPEMSLDLLRAIADPTLDLDVPMKGPFRSLREGLGAAHVAAVELAKLSGLLPAVLVATKPHAKSGFANIAARDISAYDDEVIRTLAHVARARVPLEGAEHAEMVSFRPIDGGPEHFAIIIGTPLPRQSPLVRLHSECFTGDLLGSLKCDCGSQLRGAVETIAKAGSGIILYLAQEGRGIGLINKLRAYRLQDQGFDTFTANERLGFEADERRYGIAARMLQMLGFHSVRLLSNNPDKVRRLQEAGIRVVARVAHAFPENVHNRRYLKTKADKAGHVI